MYERSFLLYDFEFSDSAQRSSLELKCQDFLLDYYLIANLRLIFVACLLNSANNVFFVIALFVIWSDIRGSPVDVGRSSSPLINRRENKGDRHLLSSPFQTGRPPDAQFFFFFLQRRNNCCWHSLLQSRLALAIQSGNRSFRLQVVSPTGRFAYTEVDSLTQVKSIPLHTNK